MIGHMKNPREPVSSDKNKALDAAMAQIERAFGKGSIMKMGAKAGDEQIAVISSGSLGLDLALGIGGLPRGRVIEIYGPESSAAPARSSTPSMRSIRSMPANSAWTLIIC